jgi:hypothetical protein
MNFRALLAIALLTMSSLAFSETRLTAYCYFSHRRDDCRFGGQQYPDNGL